MDKYEILLEQWKKAIELYQQGTEHIHQKIIYFIVINIALFSAYGYILLNPPIDGMKHSIQIDNEIIKWFIPILGLLMSFIWTLIHKRNQEYSIFRCEQAKEIERELKFGVEQVLFIMYSISDDLDGKKIKNIKQMDFEKWIEVYKKKNRELKNKHFFKKLFTGKLGANDLILSLYKIFIIFWCSALIFNIIKYLIA